jgi:uncharacterized membrane protein
MRYKCIYTQMLCISIVLFALYVSGKLPFIRSHHEPYIHHKLTCFILSVIYLDYQLLYTRVMY